ncbi:ATP synthase F0 subunit B [bacterium]|nr:ATP synthase F0 subunit B [bacterium]
MSQTASLASLTLPAINAVIYGGLLTFLYRKYGKNILASRSNKVRGTIESAAQELHAAQERYEHQADLLNNFDAERKRIEAILEEEGKRIAERILEDAQVDAERIAAETKRQISREYALTERSLKQEAARMATALLRSRLKTEFSAEDDKQLRARVIESLAAELEIGAKA